MDDLVTWLRAQLDEDGRLIDAYDEWQRALPAAAIVIPPGWLVGEPFDVDRQRAEVDAKRRILDRCVQAYREQGIYGEDGQEQLAEDVLSLHVLPYADRPGYRDEWKP